MKLEIKIEKKYGVLKISGSMGNEVLYEIESEIKHLIDKKINIIIDLSKVTFVCSSGLALLIRYFKVGLKKNFKFILAGINDDIKQIFEVTEANKFLTVAEDLDEAISIAEEES